MYMMKIIFLSTLMGLMYLVLSCMNSYIFKNDLYKYIIVQHSLNKFYFKMCKIFFIINFLLVFVSSFLPYLNSVFLTNSISSNSLDSYFNKDFLNINDKNKTSNMFNSGSDKTVVNVSEFNETSFNEPIAGPSRPDTSLPLPLPSSLSLDSDSVIIDIPESEVPISSSEYSSEDNDTSMLRKLANLFKKKSMSFTESDFIEISEIDGHLFPANVEHFSSDSLATIDSMKANLSEIRIDEDNFSYVNIPVKNKCLTSVMVLMDTETLSRILVKARLHKGGKVYLFYYYGAKRLKWKQQDAVDAWLLPSGGAGIALGLFIWIVSSGGKITLLTFF